MYNAKSFHRNRTAGECASLRMYSIQAVQTGMSMRMRCALIEEADEVAKEHVIRLAHAFEPVAHELDASLEALALRYTQRRHTRKCSTSIFVR